MKDPITTHVLDTAMGRPAVGIAVSLHRFAPEDSMERIGSTVTDEDGRVMRGLHPGDALEPGVYRMTFDTESHLRRTHGAAFYPSVDITFRVSPGETHYHVPLLLSPFGYSTYRGS